MALLILDLDKRIGNAKAWRDTFAEKIPDLEIRIWPDPGEFADIEYLAFMHPDFDALPKFPNLKAMFSRSARAEAFVDQPTGVGEAFCQQSNLAKGPAEKNGAAGRRSNDDRVRRHARTAVSSRHAG